MKHILFCCENYFPSVGGVQEVVRQIAERLALIGNDVTVATGTHPGRASRERINNVDVISFDIVGNFVTGMTGELDRFRQFILSEDFDVIVIKAAQQWSFDAIADSLSEISAKKVFIPCGFSSLYDPRYADYYHKMPQWLDSFNELIFYSQDYQDIDFARKHDISHFHIVPNGVDEREFFGPCSVDRVSDFPHDKNSKVFLAVGSLIVSKGHWDLVRAFKRMKIDGHAVLVVNGNAPNISTYRRALLNIKNIIRGYFPFRILVHFWNFVFKLQSENKKIILVDLSRPCLISLYKAADLFLFLSHVEYSPLVLFEAAASGTPFVSSDVGNAREIARWTGAGVVVDSGRTEAGKTRIDVGRFAATAEALLSDAERLEKMKSSGPRAILEQGFTWEKIAGKYWDIICGSSSNSAAPICE